MPVLVNAESGLAEDLPQESFDQAIRVGTHHVPLNDPQGNPVTAPYDEAQKLVANQGYTQPEPDQLKSLLDYSKFSTPTEKLKAFGRGALEASTFGASDAIEIANGTPAEDIRMSKEVNSPYHTAGTLAGLGVSSMLGLGEAAALEKAGSAAVKAAGLAGEGFYKGVAGGALRGAVETALFQGGDEVSKLITQDPDQSAGTAMANIGLSGLLGTIPGGAFGALSPTMKAVDGTKIGQFIEDFKSRVREHLDNPNPAESLATELGDYYTATKDVADEVYGPKGLKSQEIEKLMPQMSDKIKLQAENISTKLENGMRELADDPYIGKLQRATEKFQSEATEPNASASDVFNSAQNLKQQLQEWGKFNKDLVPLSERDFRFKAKELSHYLRESLEDPEVWGKAAERQQAINGAFKEYLPALKDFEKRFTTQVGGERTIDPGKINTFYNQLGKPTAEIKQDMLKNFIESSQKYRKVIDDTHANLGIESPVQPTSLNQAMSTLEKKTPGARVADALISRGLAGVAGKTMGAAIGGLGGHAAGAGWMGALIGEHALGPLFTSILPSVVKPILESGASPEGFKGAIAFGNAVVKGEAALNKASKALFRVDSAHELIPSSDKRDKLKKKLDKINMGDDTASVMNVGGGTGHYLPAHGQALAQNASQAIQYLNSLKPSTDKLGPLDRQQMPSRMVTETYDRALDIADNPLVTISHMKTGTLRPDDVKALASMYPGTYSRMKQKLTDEIIAHTSKEQEIPYKTKLNLSLFLGAPLDASMTPQSIQASQTMPIQAKPQPSAAKPGKSNLGALSKMPSMAMTPLQARMNDRSGA